MRGVEKEYRSKKIDNTLIVCLSSDMPSLCNNEERMMKWLKKTAGTDTYRVDHKARFDETNE